MEVDKYGIGFTLVGLAIVLGMFHFYFGWNWLNILSHLLAGGFTLFGILFLIVGLLLIFL